MKYIVVLFSVLLTGSTLVSAQNIRFPNEGVIEFEKKVNMFAIIGKVINKDNESYLRQALEQYKKSQPQFRVLKSTLAFSNGKTLYTPIESTDNAGGFGSLPGVEQPNTVFTDLLAGQSTVQKKVFEQTFLVKDSIRNITWKITDETREIAGYPCRRANALVLDSIYVVAFYTDKIPVSGGPESFTGLPGMILGLALPHDNMTWFATSVTEKPVAATVKPPVKGKAVDTKGFIKTLETSLKQYGDYAKTAIRAYLL